jgi:hypothetical protein
MQKKKKRKVEKQTKKKKKGKVEKKNEKNAKYKKLKKNTLLLTIVIHNDFGVGKQ